LKQIYIPSEGCSSQKIRGPDFNEQCTLDSLLDSYQNFGIQGSNLWEAIEEVKKMIHWRLSDEPLDPEKDLDELADPSFRKNVRCTIFLGYTSNMISSGMREIIRYLVEHKMVDCIVTSAGGIEEDIMKCFDSFYLGSFEADDKELRKKALNRIGNIYVESKTYGLLENWLLPIFQEMYDEQKQKGTIWSPRSIIRRLGQKIDNKESVYY